MKFLISVLFALTLLTSAAAAAPATFDFRDSKGTNVAIFKLEAPLEVIQGSANGISGTVTFDPENPAATKGRIVVASASLVVPNAMMKSHLHGAEWLDVAKFPEITFESKELKNIKTSGTNTTADIVGTFTLKGVSKELTVPVRFTYLKDKLSQRVSTQTGDLLVLRSEFAIKRGDFNIQPGQNENKVSNTINLTLSLVGAAPR
jgi:polyisoprenoid-binding protein YceI